jgi:hypothetical protein
MPPARRLGVVWLLECVFGKADKLIKPFKSRVTVSIAILFSTLLPKLLLKRSRRQKQIWLHMLR